MAGAVRAHSRRPSGGPGLGWGQMPLAVRCLRAPASESCAGSVIALARRRMARHTVCPAWGWVSGFATTAKAGKLAAGYGNLTLTGPTELTGLGGQSPSGLPKERWPDKRGPGASQARSEHQSPCLHASAIRLALSQLGLRTMPSVSVHRALPTRLSWHRVLAELQSCQRTPWKAQT